ncbi:MAG: bifunctional phosphoribosylaminoimidazolecarboxamide formyltransferase/IMP cyclohydrolase [Candidatus Omnitrophica bacterium]|nr:bifunctional phosphoribosylaminoimidazolecarboxamide formyltransferase/IMP cyclohydrolase [Candidatus Omnitrophota bacterium]MDE2009482.1 bifunctional phosphoribosylaminoimidazolecarboxamide formyltransferase/IMP cyclohydrolase [Candidatus Omnitrophota bacterium]MDE2214693.1 bifunctional phosphoribosylaminoimidazolecarboxamide formyltransferase/IMP cyclohydrolase [Candidatus Omnitrophota bacterium]
MIKVKRALISVSDKTGLVEFARGLQKLGIEIISTGGTAVLLRSSNIDVREVGEYTGFPEMLDGRVKTLHPKIHAGLLALRDNPEHMKQIAAHGIGLIDMVVVNLYPFEKAIQKKNISLEEAIENIDIGGPSMLRSAAKNYKSVAVICNAGRYAEILNELNNNSGILSDKVLSGLAIEVFELTRRYDASIHEFLRNRFKTDNSFSSFPKEFSFSFNKVQDLRYGENPHQAAAFYKDGATPQGLAGLKQLQGKELSFNNILDLNAAVDIIREFDLPAAVIIKHNNPCGVAQDKSIDKAYTKAYKCDSLSAFGSIIGFNRTVDAAAAAAVIKSGFVECIVAPDFTNDARALFAPKKNLRLLVLDIPGVRDERYDFKKVSGGLLLQEKDTRTLNPAELKIVSRVKPTQLQMDAMVFGWKLIKHVKSNAIALVKGTQTVGIGCGQTSRVDAAIHAIRRAGKAARGSVLISDAFLPMPDTVTIAAKSGIKAIIQTGGSIMDETVIKEADKKKIAMVMTGVRHFKH